MSGRLLCPVCGDVIGVYEPLLVVGAGSVRTSSLARESLLRDSEELIVHRACGQDLAGTRKDGSVPAESPFEL
jgi:hypothetical protein